MEVNRAPFQYENENFIILFCKNEIELKKIHEWMKNKEDKWVRCMKGNETRYEWDSISSSFFQEYIDSLNMEEYIKKCKYIIDLEGEDDYSEYIERYQKKIYIGKEFQENEMERVMQMNEEQNLEEYKKWKMEHKEEMKEATEKKSIEKKIEDPMKGKQEKMEGLHVITYVRRMEGNDIYFQLQIKCILENYKSKYVENMIVVGKGIEETFQRMEFERIEGKKLILIDDDDDNITFQDLFYIANQIFENQMVMLIRADIIFVHSPKDLALKAEGFMQNEAIENLNYEFMLHEKRVYSLTRIERDIQGKFVRIPPNQNLFGGVEQDAWIFKTPIECKDEKNIECIKHVDFNERFSELYMNRYLVSHGYELINDIRNYKIIRVNLYQDLSRRDLIKNPSKRIEDEKIYLLPEYEMIENMTIEQLILSTGVKQEEMYEIKKEMMNRYFMKYLR
jgi:hypothetical protein